MGSRLRLRAGAAAALACVVVSQSPSPSPGPVSPLGTTCGATLAGSTFDLSVMTITNGGTYQTGDSHDSTTTFYWNYCANSPAPQKAACTKAQGNRPAGVPGAIAWQDQTRTGSCYMAGGPASAGWYYSLIDPVRPHFGVRVTAPTGESTYCPGGANRSFTVELQCAPVSIMATPPLAANVFETDGLCRYRMILQSVAGCPTACISNNGGGGGAASLCSGNGVCGYDSDNKYSKCFCYAGSTGPTCGSAAAAASAVGVEGGLLIAVCLVLVAVIGMTVFMFLKLRKLQIDPAAYSELEGRFNELGMVA